MENENYTAYDLEKEEPGHGGLIMTGKHAAAGARKGRVSDGGAVDGGQSDGASTKDGQSDGNATKDGQSDGSASDGAVDESESAAPEAELKARGEIEAMMADMGAEKLLEIIRENRNAAISQILDEMERTPREPMQSGRSVGGFCNSIFDLAGMA